MLDVVRADRLLAALLVLQARERVTAAELAAELEVSERTARRDLEALSMAGVPVYPQRGRDGGWRLVGGYRTDLSGLTTDEARALFLVAGPSAPGTPAVKAALRKLIRALPETMRSSAEAASTATMVDPTAWNGAPVDAPRHLDELRDAVVARRQVVLAYASPRSAPSTRVVHPYGLVSKRGVWYLVAGTDKGQRTFRLSRVTSVVVTDDPADRPEDFDLAAVWAGVLERVESWRPQLAVRISCPADLAGHLQHRFADRVQGVVPDHDDVEVEVMFFDEHHAASELAGYGGRLEVRSPEPVRAALARLADELSAIYVAGR